MTLSLFTRIFHCWPRLACLAGAVLTALSLAAPARAAEEISVKAAVLYNLMPFMTWPAEVLKPGEPLHLCVFEEGALLAALQGYQGKPIRGNPLSIRRIGEASDAIAGCHAVMIEVGHPGRLARAAAVSREQPLLVLAEGAGVVGRGAMVGIGIEGGKVVFEIDLVALKRANVKASSRLLTLARRLVE